MELRQLVHWNLTRSLNSEQMYLWKVVMRRVSVAMNLGTRVDRRRLPAEGGGREGRRQHAAAAGGGDQDWRLRWWKWRGGEEDLWKAEVREESRETVPFTTTLT